jgi:hypothetical protein
MAALEKTHHSPLDVLCKETEHYHFQDDKPEKVKDCRRPIRSSRRRSSGPSGKDSNTSHIRPHSTTLAARKGRATVIAE